MPLFASKEMIKGLQSKVLAALGFFTKWFKPKQHLVVYKLVVLSDLPNRLKNDVLYVVEEDGFQEQAAMICPCGCGQVLHMNLLDDERPCWEVTVNADLTPSLHPSVWRQVGCKSHFWFKNGKVQFV